MNMKYGKPSEDLSGVKFGDKRLDKRLQSTVELKEQQIQGSILSGCGNKHSAKAFYALLSNKKYSRDKISEKAFESTSNRILESETKRVLAVQDTSDIDLNGHKKTEDLGYCSEHIKGVKLHSCLVLLPNGVPLGLIGQQYESRKVKKINLTHEEKAKRPIEEKESFRWLEMSREMLKYVPDAVESVVICDREGDFYELYADMLSLETSFVVRLTQNRITTDGEKSISQLKRTKPCGEVEIDIPRNTRKNMPARKAKMEIACCSVAIKRPKRVTTNLPDNLTLNLVRITETGETKDEPIEWFLATNLPISDDKDIMEIVEYYVHRWKIERMHYILKSGCQAEKIQQRTLERTKSVLLIYTVIAAFILAMTYMARSMPDVSCDVFLEEEEWKILYCLINRKKKAPDKPYSLKTAIEYLGELGSYKHAPSDGEYGAKSIWIGLCKLFDAIDIIGRLMG